MYGKSNMETYNTMCKIDSQWKFVVTQGTQTGALSIQRGGMGRKMGEWFQRKGTWEDLWLIHVDF